MKIVFNKNGGRVTMSQEEGVVLRNKIINDLTWQKYLSDASYLNKDDEKIENW